MCPYKLIELTVLLCHIYLEKTSLTVCYFLCLLIEHWLTFWKVKIPSRKFYKEAVATLTINKEKSMHSVELHVFVIAVYTCKLFAVHIFYLILWSMCHSGTLLLRLKCILLKRISQHLISFRERISLLEHLCCPGTFISGWIISSTSSFI